MSTLNHLPLRPLARRLLPIVPIHTRYRGLATLPIFSLEGKICVVTGAGRGLGKEFLTAFALSGANGACVDISLEASRSSISSITSEVKAASQSPTPSSPSSIPNLLPYACDVRSEQATRETFAAILRDFGRVDVLVTAAGIVENAPAEETSVDEFQKVMDVNLKGSFLWAKEVGRYWLKEGVRGNLILVSSMSAMICVRPQKQVAYNASKAAVSLMGKTLATEWAPKGIRVNSLCPGYMKTDLIRELLEKQGAAGEQMEKEWVRDIPMGRMAHPSELRGTIVWMASDASSYLNGSDVVVDGGYCCW
ncbi:short-chain dehydrogenase/reductase-like protein SDR [Xylogone sp. PMI_703]|nr:short-chain dehydrogenase/reductase-like protein SDR [Xylogone sp. PMI_703]